MTMKSWLFPLWDDFHISPEFAYQSFLQFHIMSSSIILFSSIFKFYVPLSTFLESNLTKLFQFYLRCPTSPLWHLLFNYKLNTELLLLKLHLLQLQAPLFLLWANFNNFLSNFGLFFLKFIFSLNSFPINMLFLFSGSFLCTFWNDMQSTFDYQAF